MFQTYGLLLLKNVFHNSLHLPDLTPGLHHFFPALANKHPYIYLNTKSTQDIGLLISW